IGNDGDAAQRQPLPESFIISEQKHFVLLERPAQRRSKLIPLERRYRGQVRSIGDVEEIAGVQSTVAQVFEDRSMQLVCARRSHSDNMAAGPFPILSAIAVLARVDFPHGIADDGVSVGSCGPTRWTSGI